MERGLQTDFPWSKRVIHVKGGVLDPELANCSIEFSRMFKSYFIASDSFRKIPHKNLDGFYVFVNSINIFLHVPYKQTNVEDKTPTNVEYAL
jgi:hypothetical protein